MTGSPPGTAGSSGPRAGPWAGRSTRAGEPNRLVLRLQPVHLDLDTRETFRQRRRPGAATALAGRDGHAWHEPE